MSWSKIILRIRKAITVQNYKWISWTKTRVFPKTIYNWLTRWIRRVIGISKRWLLYGSTTTKLSKIKWTLYRNLFRGLSLWLLIRRITIIMIWANRSVASLWAVEWLTLMRRTRRSLCKLRIMSITINKIVKFSERI